MRFDTVSLLYRMQLVIFWRHCCITVEITTDIWGKINSSPILCGFPAFAISCEIYMMQLSRGPFYLDVY